MADPTLTQPATSAGQPASTGVRTRSHQATTRWHGMVTVSPVMHELFELTRRIAKTRASVLIRGESGTGKELISQAIHDESPRARGPFRAANCATFTPELLASELFGHVRGAFTGAIRDRRGLFELADGGTLFLDEIAEIPLSIQAQLLRVLQDGTFVPVGGTDPVTVDVRIVAATHRSLRAEVEARRFRADLMYRIRVVPLFLPPLRARPGDIEALVWHFIDQFNEAYARRVEGITDGAMKCLLAHDWPGNVREVRNVLEYAFAVGTGAVIHCCDLTPELRGEGPPQSVELRPMNAHDLERHRILEALSEANGRKGQAAELLGLSRSTLWRKMREHQLS
jgi:transcriptional regulator with PAS, ATPase and Fis domain